MLFPLLPQANAADTKEQQQRAGAPVLGYSFGAESRELRAILGVPGSSTWSQPLTLPEGVTNVRVANGHRWALTESEGQTGILILDTLQNRKLDDAGGAIDDAVFSPGGSAAAVPRGSVMAVYSGLPDAPVRTASIDAAAETIAVSDSGEAAAVIDGRIVKASTGDFLTACAAAGCRIAFFPNSDSLAILDGGRLIEFRDGDSRVIAEDIAAEFQNLAAGTSRLVLTGKEHLLVLDRTTGKIVAEEDIAGADRLESMLLPGTWLLSAAEGSAAWLYGNDGMRFVPAARAAAGSKE